MTAVRQEPGSGRWRRAAARLARGAVAAGPLLLWAAAALAAEPSADDHAALEKTLAENAWLRVRGELAATDGFHLVLDASGRALRLMHGGAMLHETPLLAIEAGTSRVLFFGRTGAQWEPRIWSGPVVDPPANWQRTVITPPPPDAPPDEQVTIPPTPEEAFPTPPRYVIRYDGGLAIEFVPPEGASPGFGSRVEDALAAIGFGTPDRLRLRLTLDAAQAAAFYRALPPDTRFLFVPAL